MNLNSVLCTLCTVIARVTLVVGDKTEGACVMVGQVRGGEMGREIGVGWAGDGTGWGWDGMGMEWDGMD